MEASKDFQYIKDLDYVYRADIGLSYSSPCRGAWNIVHYGTLVPEGHQIYVCPVSCLRGVVLTTAEMGFEAMKKLSTIAVGEDNILNGDLEEQVLHGAERIIETLEKRPRMVMIFTSCIHHFLAVNYQRVYKILREEYPDIDFIDCYMNPIMRKSGLTPDQLMRSRLYMLLHERTIDPKAVAIIGNDLPTDEDSDLMKVLKGAGLKVHEITSCKTYEEYQQMAESRVYISYNPDAAPGGDMLSERLGGTHYALKFSFDYDEIDATFAGLAEVLGIAPRSSEEISALRAECEKELKETNALVGDTPVSIDYTYCPRPLGLAKLLLDHGMNVTRVYADGIPGGDRAAFDILQKEHPDLMIYPTVHPGMRFARTANVEAQNGVKILAIGQKAAAFDETDHFVNVVEGGGMTGYEAITRTCRLMREAFLEKKEMRELVQVKGLGCEVCIR